MPGGSKFRQWYAARQAMRQRGTWHGNRPPTHSVPQLEDGEPPAQRPRTGTLRSRADLPSSPEGSPSDPIAGLTPDSSPPSLEASPTAEGR